jgi:predicted transcriptional regulator
MNYSFETSYPAYRENEASNKTRQCDEVFQFIKRGANNLLQISELTGLPQSTIAARINDLISESKIKYDGFVVYEDRKRKRIMAIRKEVKQLNFF